MMMIMQFQLIDCTLCSVSPVNVRLLVVADVCIYAAIR